MTNVSTCVKQSLFIALLAIISSDINTAALTTDAAIYNQMTAAVENKLDYISAKESEELINLINSIYGDLACLIQADAITIADKEQKSNVITEITQTRMVINQLYRTFLNEPTQAQLDHALKILNLMLKQLEKSLKSDITKYQAFKAEDAVNRSKLNDTVDLDALKESIAKTKEYTLQVKKAAENAGLYWYNHVYRNTLDRFVVQPCNKYNIHWKVFGTSVALAASSYIWYRLNTSIAGCSSYDAGLAQNEEMTDYQSWSEEDPLWKQLPWKMHDWINGNIRHYLGWSASMYSSDSLTTSNNKRDSINSTNRTLADNLKLQDTLQTRINAEPHNKKELVEALSRVNSIIDNCVAQIDLLSEVKADKPHKWLAHLEEEAYKMHIGWWGIFMTLLYAPYKDTVNAQVDNVSTKVNSNLKKLHSWLKGGAYYQQFKMTEHQFMVKPRFDFDNIIGHEHAKEKLGYIIKYIKDPENYDRAQLDPTKAILLYGPTRTGKSMIAEALAGEAQRAKGGKPEDFPFLCIDARHIAYYGSFKFIMELVQEKAPCIIFLDEIDMLNLHRGEFKDNNKLLGDFLSTLSGCLNNDPDKKVIVLAATNTPEMLDNSLLSRFEQIPFEYPSFMHRAEAILRELQGKGLPHEQFDIKKLAEQTEGCSYEQIHKIVNDAQLITRESGRPVTQLDVEHSINTILRNIIYHDYKDLPENELKVLSVHMTGHAMAYILTEGSEQFSQVTIRPVRAKIDKDFSAKNTYTKPIIKYGHVFTHAQGDTLKLTSKKDLKRKCMIELAGHVAEEMILDTHFTTPHSCSGQDTTEAFKWAKKYVLDGIDENLVQASKVMQNKIIQDAYAFIETCKQELHTLFTEHKDVMVFVADILQKLTVLDADALKEAINIHKMLGGKSLEEFFADLQKQAELAQTDAPQAPVAA